MATKKKDAYSKLKRIVLVLFVFTVAAVVGYVLVDQSIVAQQEENMARANEENQQLDAAYRQKVAQEIQQFNEETALVWPEPKGEEWEIVDLSNYPVQNANMRYVEQDELITNGLMLLNHWHSLPNNFPESALVSMISVDKTVPVKNSSVKLFPNAAAALSRMLAAAKDEGLENFLIEEAYRTRETQQKLYDEKAAKYVNSLYGDPLIAKVRQEVNVPGTSEYQSGLSFRVDRWLNGDAEFNDPKFQTTEHSDWLVENSWKYGFVFRFPVEGYPNATMQDKSHKTGESKKLSLYRYVGVEHAEIMHEMNFCMEEYIEFLMQNPHFAVYKNGQKVYEITWQPLDNLYSGVQIETDMTAIESIVSMDNVGGVVTCMVF